jgi:hypothetical protein
MAVASALVGVPFLLPARKEDTEADEAANGSGAPEV